jgi:sulfur-carrier protein adenylyltransferase/sulfurtransferase
MSHALYRNSAAHADGFRDADPLLVHDHLKENRAGEFRIVDVREPDEFVGELGHIPGAELAPLSTVTHVARGWDREKEVLVVCRSGGRSANAARQLVAMGFTHVINMRGGMLAYNAAKLPVSRQAAGATI